ncbi:hypothetical protein FRC01_006951 [Tulasnella sp. 417]|nr:hypothetical protein FRC01_006951 [Tulasnella sp. 417]
MRWRIATLAEENQGLRKALDEVHQAGIAAQAEAEKVAQELKEKMREELGKISQSLEVCIADVLDLQSKYPRVFSDADNYRFSGAAFTEVWQKQKEALRDPAPDPVSPLGLILSGRTKQDLRPNRPKVER